MSIDMKNQDLEAFLADTEDKEKELEVDGTNQDDVEEEDEIKVQPDVEEVL